MTTLPLHSRSRVPLEALRMEPMANGWRSILLTELIDWEDFLLSNVSESFERVLRKVLRK